MLPCPISFEAVDRYAQRYGLTGHDEFEEFQHLLAAMDRKYIDHMMKKAARQSSNSDKGGPPQPRETPRTPRRRKPAT